MPKSKSPERMVAVCVNLPRGLLEELNKLVQKKIYPNRSEAIREAVRELLQRKSDLLE